MRKNPSRQIVANNLTRFMAQSQDLKSNLALGKRAKVGHSHIGRILRGESSATTDMLDALASALGVQTWELLTDSEATREAALRKIMFGRAVQDEYVEQHLGTPPPKTTSYRKRKAE